MSWSPRSLLTPVVLFLGLDACGGGDLCNKYEKEFDACPDDSFTSQECQEQIGSCNSEDQKLLDDFLKCIKDEGQFECDREFTNTSDMFQFLAAVQQCGEPLSGLSEDCDAFASTQI